MIYGRFFRSRPTIRGLLLFSPLGAPIPVDFVVDTGADVTLIAPTDYATHRVRYSEIQGIDIQSAGYGGRIEAKLAQAALYLRDEAGRYIRILLEAEFSRPDPANEGLPSVLGRDVLDLFRLTVDRSVNLVCLDAASGSTDEIRWPDEHDDQDGAPP